MFVAIDANFRLKRRAISNEKRDPALGSGWGYFVEDGAYRQYLQTTADQKDVRIDFSCFVAIDTSHRADKYLHRFCCVDARKYKVE